MDVSAPHLDDRTDRRAKGDDDGRQRFAAAAVTTQATAVMVQTADIMCMPATGSTEVTADRLVAAIGNAGANVAARRDHGAAAAGPVWR
jgi:hypothetical protein